MISASILLSFWMVFHQFSILFRHRFLHAFLDVIFSIFRSKMVAKVVGSSWTSCPLWHPKNAPKTHPRRNLDFSSILDRFWSPVWSAAPRRGGERVKLLESIRYFQVSSAPLTPGTTKKSIQNPRRSPDLNFLASSAIFVNVSEDTR